MRLFRFLMGVPGNLEETALSQLEELGFSAEDVRHIIFTHRHIEGRPSDQQPLNFLPASLARQMIGGHGPALRELKDRPGGEITLINSHDIYSFKKLRGGNLAIGRG